MELCIEAQANPDGYSAGCDTRTFLPLPAQLVWPISSEFYVDINIANYLRSLRGPSLRVGLCPPCLP